MEDLKRCDSNGSTGTKHEGFRPPQRGKFPNECENDGGEGKRAEERQCGPWIGRPYRNIASKDHSISNHVKDKEGTN